MKKKNAITIATSMLFVIGLTIAINAYQVSHVTKPIDDTSMHGYLYRSSSSSYVFTSETTIDSNPNKDASLYVSVTVVPLNTTKFETQFEENETDRSQHISVTSPSASTTNASSASGYHVATIWDNTQSSSNYGSTSWDKTTGN